MILTAEIPLDQPQDAPRPVLVLEPKDRGIAADVGKLSGSVDDWVVQELEEARRRDAYVLRGAPASRLFTALGEAASGTILSPGLQRVEVEERLQEKAKQLFAPKPEATLDNSRRVSAPKLRILQAIAPAVPAQKPEAPLDTSPSLADKLIITGLTKATKAASNLIPAKSSKRTGRHRKVATA